MPTDPTKVLRAQEFFQTTLSSAITASDTTIPLTSAPTANEGFLVIESTSASAREVVFYNSKSGSSVIVPSTGDRGLFGTSAQSHASGAMVEMNMSQGHYEALRTGKGIDDDAILTRHLATNAVGIVRLAAIEAADLFNGDILAATTWTDFKANQNFTVDNSGSIIIVWVSGVAIVGSSSAVCDTGTRIVIDSAGTPITRYIGGGRSTAVNQFDNIFKGAGPVLITGLAAGTHTIKTQVWAQAANSTIYCRAATAANQEFFTTNVLEIKT